MTSIENMWAKHLVGVLVVIGFLTITGYIVAFGLKVDANSAALVGQVIGSVGTLAGLVVGYWYGSSAGSAAKDQVIAEQTNTAATVAKEAVAATKPPIALTENMRVDAENVEVKEK